MEFTTIDRVFSKVNREIKDLDIPESDIIEWTGEALEFLKVNKIQSQYLTILPVKGYQADIPIGFQSVLQVARFHDDYDFEGSKCKKEIETEALENLQQTPIRENKCNPCPDCYKPYFDMQWQFIDWKNHEIHQTYFKPVRLSNNTLFKSVVCKEKDFEELYQNTHCEDEYTVVGTTNRKLRFSFSEGTVALAYNGTALDKDSGYPLIPDNISYLTAITYYIRWKISEKLDYSGREGYSRLSDRAEERWLRYVRQAKNWAKMPKTMDEYQNLMEQTHSMVPRFNSYYNYFGNLGQTQNFNI